MFNLCITASYIFIRCAPQKGKQNQKQIKKTQNKIKINKQTPLHIYDLN